MDVSLSEAFRFCPRCGTQAPLPGRDPLECAACGFRFHFTPVTGAVAIIPDQRGRVLVLRRARDPGKGLYGLPGGFVDPGESIEEALRREVQEEVGLTLTHLCYLGSFPNRYHYRGVIVPVTDVVFVCQAADLRPQRVDSDEVAGFAFRHPGHEVLSQMAFDSNRRGLERYLERRPSGE